MEDDSLYSISAKLSKQSKLTSKFEEILMAEAELHNNSEEEQKE